MKLNNYILICISVLLLYSCSGYSEKEKGPVVKHGVADLSGGIIPERGIIELAGEWEFYYGELLEPRDFKSPDRKSISYLKVPGDWDSFVFNGKKAGSWGSSTYRLNITTGNDDPLYVKLMPPNSAYRLWVNGIFYGECGKVGKSISEEKPEYKLVIYELKPVDKKIEVIIQVSNHSIYLGGLVLPVTIGLRENIYNEKSRMIAFDVMLFVSLLIINVYYFGLFLMRRSDKSSLFFSIFTLLLSARSLVTNEMFLYQLLPHADWEKMYKIDFLATTLCVPVFIYFIYLLYPSVVRSRLRYFFVFTAAVYSVMIIFFPVRLYSQFLPVYNAVTFFACFYVFYIVVIAMINRLEGSRLTFLGFIILFGTVINDILSVYNITQNIQLSSFGVFSFILIQSLISYSKLANTYKRIEDLSHNLEIKVDLRTRELEKEKELLQARNRTIEQELVIARKIQMQIIPSESPAPNFHAFYKPMDKVGGDFYDFLRYRDPNKIGIFLSDVSGHGVPAAFITSMIKTSILQAGADREDPAVLLSLLNELLLNQTGGNFITAFYGIYNPTTREFIYSNSGHNPPLIFSSGKVKKFTGKKSMALAIMNNEERIACGKHCSNETIILEKGSKILFYTDGLTEAVSSDDRNIYFEQKLVSEIMQKYSGDSPKGFIVNVYNELVNFHGSDSFEDDICMICMDVE